MSIFYYIIYIVSDAVRVSALFMTDTYNSYTMSIFFYLVI